MKTLIGLLMISSMALFCGYSDIYSGSNNYNSPVEIVCRYPYTVVHYDSTEAVSVPVNQAVDMSVNIKGKPHHLRYYNGWWFDYDSGTGFPARYQP